MRTGLCLLISRKRTSTWRLRSTTSGFRRNTVHFAIWTRHSTAIPKRLNPVMGIVIVIDAEFNRPKDGA